MSIRQSQTAKVIMKRKLEG